MHKEAYGGTDNYLGLDTEQFRNDRATLVCDNRRYLRMADLDEFDLFDLDAYGSPFEQFAIICTRLQWTRAKTIGFVLTDGTGMNSRFNAMNRQFLNWIGAKTHLGGKVQMTHREDFIVAALIKGAEVARGTVQNIMVAYKDGGKSGSDMRYIGFTITESIQ